MPPKCTTSAVSYTHLDVYKRQIWRCLNEVTQKLLPWRYKKAYLEVTMLENANLSDTLRYFECCDKAKVINDKWLSERCV